MDRIPKVGDKVIKVKKNSVTDHKIGDIELITAVNITEYGGHIKVSNTNTGYWEIGITWAFYKEPTIDLHTLYKC